MSFKKLYSKKAATLFAAFFICGFRFSFIFGLGAMAYAAPKESLETFDDIKKSAIQFLVKKQKSEALQVISKWMKAETNRSNTGEANDFLIKISQTFLNKDAQDAYEGSLNATLETPKDALKLIDTCLQFEPENLDCLMQKTRLAYRDKNRSVAEKTLAQMGELAKGNSLYFWADLFLQKDLPNNEFKNKIIVKKSYDKASEENFVLTVLEIERSLQAKNFSKARGGVEFLEKNYSDYPDNIYFKQRLDSDSVEEKSTSQADALQRYLAKCKSLTRSVARKFRYDFDLCQRGQ